MEKISEHISYKEATRSNTAIRYGIENTPGTEEIKNMQRWAEKIFEPLRKWAGGAIRISSFYRSPELNKKVGGSPTSSHIKGEAGDIDDVFGYKTNAEMFEYIRTNLVFDQLIWEFGDNNNPDWIHVSYREFGNRCQVLRSVKYKNWMGQTKTKYIYFS